MDADESVEVAPFVAHAGIRHLPAAGGQARAVVALSPALLNRGGSAHGGLVATLLDTTMSRAASPHPVDGGRVVTVELQVAYLAPGRGVLSCRAWVTGSSPPDLLLEGEVTDAAGTRVAHGHARLRMLRPGR